MGFFEEFGPDGNVRRGETFTCAHCNSVFEFRDSSGRFKPPTMCAREHKPLCPPCANEANRTGKCLPFERELERIERRDKLLRAAGIDT